MKLYSGCHFRSIFDGNPSKANYDIHFTNRNEIMSTCDVEVAGKPNLNDNYTAKMQCKLCNHGLFKYSMFSAPGAIIGHFATCEG